MTGLQILKARTHEHQVTYTRCTAETHLQLRQGQVCNGRICQPIWPSFCQELYQHAKLGSPVTLQHNTYMSHYFHQMNNEWEPAESLIPNHPATRRLHESLLYHQVTMNENRLSASSAACDALQQHWNTAAVSDEVTFRNAFSKSSG
jgi:hypothetical protein